FTFISLLFSSFSPFFFFNDTPPTEIYPLSLHDALPIYRPAAGLWTSFQLKNRLPPRGGPGTPRPPRAAPPSRSPSSRRTCEEYRSEEHTSELQSRSDLVCRLLLEKKKKKKKNMNH